jgi:hypothetical protein
LLPLGIGLSHLNLKHHRTTITANNRHGRLGQVLRRAVGMGTKEPPARCQHHNNTYHYFFS